MEYHALESSGLAVDLIYEPVSELRAGKCPGKPVLPLLRDEDHDASGDAAAAALRVSGAAASVFLEDRRISDTRRSSEISLGCRFIGSTVSGSGSRLYVRKLPLPELHEPVPTSHRQAHFDDRMDRIRCPARSFLSAVLGWSADQRRRASLPVLQCPSKIISSGKSSLWDVRS